MPEWLQAIVLGLLQGATEFIPVSSSAHLVIVPNLFGWPRPGVAFDVALHAGTAGAIIAYYRRDLWHMVRSVFAGQQDPERDAWRRLVLQLAVASVPVGIAGLTLRSQLEDAFATPRLAAVMLAVTAVLLLVGERIRAQRIARAEGAPLEPAPTSSPDDVPAEARPVGEPSDADRVGGATGGFGIDANDPTGTPLDRFRLWQVLTVGIAQAVALVPGLSRSGTTITAGLLAGMTRPAATRFAFLLALPAIIGATAVSLPDLAEPSVYAPLDILLGIAAAFVAGFAAIAWLTRLVARAGLHVFAVYLALASISSWLALTALGA